MRDAGFTFKYIIVLIAQILLWNYCNFTQYLTVVFLPVMILCLPISKGTIHALVTAFVSGLVVDFFASGMLGLTSLALVPVALARRSVIRLVFGQEVFSRGEDISIQRQGIPKMMLSILIVTAMFLFIYIWADGAGTRPLWFNAARFSISLLAGALLSAVIVNIFEADR